MAEGLLDNVFNNLLAVFILLGFFFIIYAKAKQQTLNETMREIISWVKGNDDEVKPGGIFRNRKY